MTTMTPSINKVFKLIFHDLTPRYPPPAPLGIYSFRIMKYYIIFKCIQLHDQIIVSKLHNFKNTIK